MFSVDYVRMCVKSGESCLRSVENTYYVRSIYDGYLGKCALDCSSVEQRIFCSGLLALTRVANE